MVADPCGRERRKGCISLKPCGGGEGIPAGACWGLPHAGGTPLCRSRRCTVEQGCSFSPLVLAAPTAGFSASARRKQKTSRKGGRGAVGVLFCCSGWGCPVLTWAELPLAAWKRGPGPLGGLPYLNGRACERGWAGSAVQIPFLVISGIFAENSADKNKPEH